MSRKVRMAQLPQRLLLKLANALARQAKHLAHLLQRARLPILQPVAQAQNARLARRKLVQNIANLLGQHLLRHRLGRRRRLNIFDKVAQLRIRLVPHGALQVHRLAAGAQHPAHPLGRQLHILRNLFRRRLAAELLLHLLRHLVQLADAPPQVGGNADGAAVVSQRARHRLANPPGRIRAEAVAAPVIILFHRLHQPHVALLDQVQKLQAAPPVFLGDAHHQARVGPDQVRARRLAHFAHVDELVLLIQRQHRAPQFQQFGGCPPGLDLHRQLHLFLRGKQPLLPHLAEVKTHRIINRDVAQIKQRRGMGALVVALLVKGQVIHFI